MKKALFVLIAFLYLSFNTVGQCDTTERYLQNSLKKDAPLMFSTYSEISQIEVTADNREDANKRYPHLNIDDSLLPKMVKEGLNELGTVGNSEYREELGGKFLNYNSSTAWCGIFLWAIAVRTGKNHILKEEFLYPERATSWAAFGYDTVSIPKLGDVLIFDNHTHVGLYIAEDALHYHVLGGNQEGKVCIAKIPKTRYLRCRMPPVKNFMPKSRQVYKYPR